jgi:hypothetical protein
VIPKRAKAATRTATSHLFVSETILSRGVVRVPSDHEAVRGVVRAVAADALQLTGLCICCEPRSLFC